MLPARWKGLIRVVAMFEAAKGLLVLAVGVGALAFLHRDYRQLAVRLIDHFHLDPARHYPHIFLDAAAGLTDTRLWILAGLAAGYALLRFIEAWGLWWSRRWAEWFAALSGGVYIPFEFLRLIEEAGWLSFGMLTANILVVALMLYYLKQ